MQSGHLPDGWDKDLPSFPADPKGMATRESSGKTLNTLAKNIPWLVGGSADLAKSNKTNLTFDGAGDFYPNQYRGRNVHFGVREHAMGAIGNGMTLWKLPAFSDTFFNFGAYILAEAPGGKPDVILMGSGSELSLCVEAADKLNAAGIKTRVVSMPSWELFEQQDAAYKESVFPASVSARVSVEMASTFGWERYVGLKGKMIGMRSFGASAPLKDLLKKFGIQVDNVVAAAKEVVGK